MEPSSPCLALGSFAAGGAGVAGGPHVTVGCMGSCSSTGSGCCMGRASILGGAAWVVAAPLSVLVAAWVVAVQPTREVFSKCQALFSLAAGAPALAEAHKCQALFSSAAGVAGFRCSGLHKGLVRIPV